MGRPVILDYFTWDNVAKIFRMYTIAILLISPLKVIISYPYYALGLIENPLETVTLEDEPLLQTDGNKTISGLCVYYKDIVAQTHEAQQFLERQCGVATTIINSAQTTNTATAIISTIVLLGRMIPDIISTVILLPYIIYRELHPFVQYHELASFGLNIFTAIWLIMHIIGLASAILFRLR